MVVLYCVVGTVKVLGTVVEVVIDVVVGEIEVDVVVVVVVADVVDLLDTVSQDVQLVVVCAPTKIVFV